MTRVLVVDDSPFVCRLLTNHIQSASSMEVVGTALNGRRAVELTAEREPDVVTMDLEMPEMNGLEALRQIMRTRPTPVVVISGVSRRAADMTLEALRLGAVDFILKYTPGVNLDPEALRLEIVDKVRAAAQVRVIRSLEGEGRLANVGREGVLPRPPVAPPPVYVRDGVVVIGASTGGPVAVRELLGQLPADFPAAIIVVQHIPDSFTDALVTQLGQWSPLPVKAAEHGERLRPGSVVVAPGDQHLILAPDTRLILNRGPKIKGYRPSIDVTMQSVAQGYGGRAAGIVLTGMGDDGTLGLQAIHSKGGRTYAQDAASCVVSGMPDRAIAKGVVEYVGTPHEIGLVLRERVTV